MYGQNAQVSDLLGKTLAEVTKVNDGVILFTTDNGDVYRMYHYQDCCESVYIEDINGDLNDLVGSPITLADEASSNDNPDGVPAESWESQTWTFYRFATAKGYVNIRWYGSSNGYYSESVDFELMETK